MDQVSYSSTINYYCRRYSIIIKVSLSLVMLCIIIISLNTFLFPACYCCFNLKCKLQERLCLTYCKGLVHCGPSSNNLHMKKTQLKKQTKGKKKTFFVSLLGFTLLCRTMKDKLFINSVLVHY